MLINLYISRPTYRFILIYTCGLTAVIKRIWMNECSKLFAEICPLPNLQGKCKWPFLSCGFSIKISFKCWYEFHSYQHLTSPVGATPFEFLDIWRQNACSRFSRTPNCARRMRQTTDRQCSALAHRRAVRTLQCWQFLVIFRFYKTLEQTRSPGDDKFGKWCCLSAKFFAHLLAHRQPVGTTEL